MQRFATVLAVCAADARATPVKTFAADGESPSFLQSQSARSSKGDQGPRHVERYGPGGCVSTWRDGTSGHCMMQTDCPESEDLTVYEFGLLCAGEGGEVTRHVFGQDSFLHRETFDTLIECEECLALDEYMDAGAATQTLARQVDSLAQGMKNVTASIARLEAAVGGPAPAPAPAQEPAPPASLFVAQRRPARPHESKRPPAKHSPGRAVPAATRPAAMRSEARPAHSRARAIAANPHAARSAPPVQHAMAHHTDHKARKVRIDDSRKAATGHKQHVAVSRNVAGKRRRQQGQDEDVQAGAQEDGEGAQEGVKEQDEDRNYFQDENRNDADDAEAEEDQSNSDDEDGPTDGPDDGAPDENDDEP